MARVRCSEGVLIVNFDFSDEQIMLRDQAERFLRENCPLSLARKVLEGEQEYDDGLWRRIAELGWCATVIPEEFGGLGAGSLDLCILAEQLGRTLAPIPFASTQYLAVQALLVAGAPRQRGKYLEAVAAGACIGTMALAEGRGVLGGRPGCFVVDNRLHGVKTLVADGMAADFAVVGARASSAGDAPLALYLADLKGARVRRSRVPALDSSRPYARIEFDDVPVVALGDGGAGNEVLSAILDRAAVLMAFEQVGGADAALSMARTYALERKAFGRPIGGYQAIKHRLADMWVRNELARSNAYYAAWALEAESAELPLAAAAARIASIDAFEFATQENIQIHGGMGYTWEMDCHLYYRRSRMLAVALGSAREWKGRLATRLIERRAGERKAAGGAAGAGLAERAGFWARTGSPAVGGASCTRVANIG